MVFVPTWQSPVFEELPIFPSVIARSAEGTSDAISVAQGVLGDAKSEIATAHKTSLAMTAQESIGVGPRRLLWPLRGLAMTREGKKGCSQ